MLRGSRRTQWGVAMVATVALAAVLPLIPSVASAATPQYRPPVITGDWPDPEIVWDESSRRFYTYATNFTVFGTEYNVPVRVSKDLTDWNAFGGDALPTLPSWAESGHTWAPGVARIGSRWVLYFTATEKASGRQCIGVARGSKPMGPFTPVGSGPLVCQRSLGGSIDASPFQDPKTGNWWLHWKSDENAAGGGGNPRIFVQRLADGGTRRSGSPKVLLTDTRAGVQRLIESPDMVFDRGRYWLGFSMNRWDTAAYASHLASCEGPTGPCTWVEPASPPWLRSDADTSGPGGGSFLVDRNGRAYFVFHGWRGDVGYGDDGRRATHIEPISWDGPGRAPRLRPDQSRSPTTPPTPTVQMQRFVTAAYDAFFDRKPRVSELYTWVQRLLGGMDRPTFIRKLSTSEEWLGREIDDLYRRALGRGSDASGRNYWRQQVIAGLPLTEVGVYFYASPEFYERSGGSDIGFVAELYRNILHREPESSGHQYWVRQLYLGVPRTEVARWFYLSVESRYDRVRRLYVTLLGRKPDPSGHAYWADVLLTQDDVRLAEFLASSREFFLRSQA